MESVRRSVAEFGRLGGASGGHRPADLAEVVGQDAPADPAFHAVAPVIAATPQAEAALEHTDAALDAGPEARRAAESGALLPCPALRTAFAGFRNGDVDHAGLGGILLIGRRGEGA